MHITPYSHHTIIIEFFTHLLDMVCLADIAYDIPRVAMVKRFGGFGFELGKENDALRREYTQAYHACVSFVDAQIGLILDKLKAQKLWNDTIVIFTSDHGYHLGEHFMWGKVSLFEECARVPLIVRVPGVSPAGKTSQGLVETIDLFPTLAELCDLDLATHAFLASVGADREEIRQIGDRK